MQNDTLRRAPNETDLRAQATAGPLESDEAARLISSEKVDGTAV